MAINVDFLKRCIATLDGAYRALVEKSQDDIAYDIYRAACVKEYEIILEQCGKLLKKRLEVYFATHKLADKLTFKDIFRFAAKHDLLDITACERWLIYRDNRNNTAHDYGEHFAETTLKLLPQFIADAQALSIIVEQQDD